MALRVLILSSLLVLAHCAYGFDQQYNEDDIQIDGKESLVYSSDDPMLNGFDSQFDSDDFVLTTIDSQPDGDDFQPDGDDSLPDNDNSQPDNNDSQLDSDDSQPDSDDSQPDSDDSQPDSDYSQPDSDDSQPESDDSQHDGDNPQPDSDDSHLDSDNSQLDSNDAQLDNKLDNVEFQADTNDYLTTSKSSSSPSPRNEKKKSGPSSSPFRPRKSKLGSSKMCAKRCHATCLPQRSVLPPNVAPPVMSPSCKASCISQCTTRTRASYIPSVWVVNDCNRSCAFSIVKRFINPKTKHVVGAKGSRFRHGGVKKSINRKLKRGVRGSRFSLVEDFVFMRYKNCFDKKMKIHN